MGDASPGRYWDIEMREIPMSHSSYAMDPASMLERVDENTIIRRVQPPVT
jgi:glutamate/tyrosine decarboxylase-like PLP-dependent enzyme